MNNKLYIKGGVVLPKHKIVVTKEVNGKKFKVYNPSEETILADGWVEYKPQVEPQQPNQEELYKQRIVELIREKYTIDDELSIQRQRDSKVDEFYEYNQFVENCKQIAYNEIYGGEI